MIETKGNIVPVNKKIKVPEDAFNKISDKIILRSLYFDNKICMEIDTKEDLEATRDMLNH